MFGSNALRLGLLLILAAVFTIPACDTLITEVNNNTIYDSTLGQTCLNSCHSDDNSLITVPKGQWLASAHASPKLIEAQINLNGEKFFTNDGDCGATCHTSEGFIEFAKNGTSTTQTTPSPIGCYTCHMPHSGNFGEWRLDSLRGQTDLVILNGGFGYDMGNSNMCVTCHQAANPAPTGTDDIILAGDWGPHFSPQAEVLSGVGGFRFGSEVSDTITHTGIAGRDGCISCHYGSSGGIGAGYDFGEHTFRLEDSLGVQFHETCNVGGCHPTETITDFYDFASLRETDSLAALIRDSLWARNILDTSDPSAVSFYSDSTLRAYNAPILYNYLLYQMDGSRGVHNPGLMLSLLTATVARLDTLPPQASFELADPADTLVCDSAGPVSFVNTSLSNDSTYLWDPGDGNPTFLGIDYTHPYSVPGTYTVRLIASGPGVDAADTAEMVIVIEGLPGAGFAADQVTFCDSTDVDVRVTFADQSVFATSWFWDFGDGATDTVQNPTHTYDTIVAAYTVTLAIDGFCGSDTLVMIDYINIRSDTDLADASFTMDSVTITGGSTVSFTNTSILADVWYWDFGDGTTDSSSSAGSFSPTHAYDSVTVVDTFEITLEVKYGCTVDIFVETLIVTP